VFPGADAAVESEEQVRELTLYRVSSEAIGYGRFGANLAKALTAAGIDVYDDMPIPAEYRRPHEQHTGAPSKLCNVVAWVSVPTHGRGWFDGQLSVVATMWESGRLPESFRDTLHEFDVVVVPSHHNLELFSRYHNNVHMVPLGVDPTVWHYEPRQQPADRFSFLIGGSGERKGTDLAWKAFQAVFGKESSWGSGPVPYLRMKSPKGGEFRAPRVEVISGRISAEAEVDLYATSHCYLGPSRGEGFGLQPLQALAQGCPTVLTAAHGHDSFAHLGLGLSAERTQSAYFVYGEAGEWWEPSFDDLCDRMRWVYDHYDDALAHAAAAAMVVAEEFTWARTAQGFVEAIGPERLEVPYSGNGSWYEPQRLRYEVVTNRNWMCEIAGSTFHFLAGQTYLEQADIKRVLWEAGVLDPVCTKGDDTGLHPSQLPIDASASQSYCGTCHQRLGSQPTRADDIEAGVLTG
jgi:glycosyltransferase involved in cell wall biosynthesis